MNILDKLFKKQNSPQKLHDNFKIVLSSAIELSEEEKNIIISIVKKSILSEIKLTLIPFAIFMHTNGINTTIHKTDNGVKVIVKSRRNSEK